MAHAANDAKHGADQLAPTEASGGPGIPSWSVEPAMRYRQYLIIGTGALIGTYFLFRPQLSTVSGGKRAPVIGAPAILPAADRIVELQIAHGALESGPTVVKLMQGDAVTLRVTTDAADELHLHGYDLHLQLCPDEPGTLHFVATRTGRFTYELHQANVELGAIEVYPR